ncbi:unnamed protein product [Brassicogethes aeneus]|uniref:Uncharacterized protein n=1 Tax=Brassicogethes aeneus TaxID=1431903 RepID=A0A9P0BDG5_BRAAE|nr:unnamed protein product [Brassicogethes aeneus]
MRLIFNVLLANSLFFVINSQGANKNETLSENWRYCYEFTWLGPDFNNHSSSSILNGTCKSYLNEKRAKNIPCSPPLVITEDGTPPNMTWLWEKKLPSILCIQSENKVCAKYTYKFNNKVHNITYMCTKAVQKNKGPLTSGCYSQTVDGYDVEACICNSDVGLRTRPCNKSFKAHINAVFLLFALIYLIL